MVTKPEIVSFLQSIKPQFEQEGLVILGIFGSYARDKPIENSDIDVLVETTARFLELHTGLGCFLRLEELRCIIAKQFHKEVDIADKSGLTESGSNILEETFYV
jgi:predicted nucleotidyltransferase